MLLVEISIEYLNIDHILPECAIKLYYCLVNFYSVVFDLFCIFRENTHEQQLIQAKILYQCPSQNILDFVYGGSHFSTGVIFLRGRHVKKKTPVTFFLHMRHVFLRPGVISLRRKMTPRSIFDGGRYSSLHRPSVHKHYLVPLSPL